MNSIVLLLVFFQGLGLRVVAIKDLLLKSIPRTCDTLTFKGFKTFLLDQRLQYFAFPDELGELFHFVLFGYLIQ